MPTTIYQYQSLDQKKAEIRLLTLHAGPWDGEIKCTLHHASLETNLEYQALSYTWGDAKDVRVITLCGSSCNITANLEMAPRHLRKVEDRAI